MIDKFSWQLTPLDLKIIDLALFEDLGKDYFDATTAFLFSKTDKQMSASIISKNSEPVVLAGIALVDVILKRLNIIAEVQTNYKDGQTIYFGNTLLTLVAQASQLLKVERTLLNFLQRLCAIATLTSQYVARIKHTRTKILDTRKTSPGLRHLEKYAVFCGGGINHRMGLYDAIMIKDTHIDCLGGITYAIRELPQGILQHYAVVVEVRNLFELDILLSQGLSKVTRVLLDNMSLKEIAESVVMCRDKLPTEASGNITLANVAEVASTGVDFISVGKITHSAGSVDLSMKSKNITCKK